MSIVKIYIQLIDGSIAWVPVDSTHVSDKQYRILDDKEYTDYIDPLYIHEYYPGDIVEIGHQTFHDGKSGQVAKKLITIGQWPDRLYNEYKFKAITGQLKIDRQTAKKYKNEIVRLIKEHSDGQFFYPILIEVTNKLDMINND